MLGQASRSLGSDSTLPVVKNPLGPWSTEVSPCRAVQVGRSSWSPGLLSHPVAVHLPYDGYE